MLCKKLQTLAAFPPATSASSCCSTTLSACGAGSAPDLGLSDRVSWGLMVVSGYISLVTYEVEHLFTCLLAVCVSSSVRGLFRCFAHFLMELFTFLVLNFKSSLSTLESRPLSDVSSADVFSCYVACLLILLTVSFTKQKFENVSALPFKQYWPPGNCKIWLWFSTFYSLDQLGASTVTITVKDAPAPYIQGL